MKEYFKKTIILGAFLILIVSFVPSCEPFVDAAPPTTQLSGETVFEDPATVRAALANCYALLCNSVLLTGSIDGLSIKLGYYADELEPYGGGQSEFAFFQNNLIATNSTINTIWSNSYNLVYALNSVLEGLENSSGISAADKEIFTGEALLMRSIIYFNLTNLFGDIPYITTTDYRANTVIPKVSITEMYARLTADLNLAQQKLPVEYAAPSRTIPNKSVAAALLARLYLYEGNWTLASQKADEVINMTEFYALENDLGRVFLKDSQSTLWQLSPSIEGMATREGQNFIFTMGPPPSRALNPLLVQAFEASDMRKQYWIGTVSNGSSAWYHAFKYKQRIRTDVSAEYSVVLRLEELYLIRAEARSHTGDLTGAANDLNVIRHRAGLQAIQATTPAQLQDAVMLERRLELFCEHGHRWFDLKRSGLAGPTLSQSKPGWNSTDILWPLPQNELLLNPALLPQNTGY